MHSIIPVVVNGNIVSLSIPFGTEGTVSKTGKSIVLATAQGKGTLTDGRPITVQVTVYTPAK